MADQDAFVAWKVEVETKITHLEDQVKLLEGQNAILTKALDKNPSSSSQRPKPHLPDPDKLAAQIMWDTFEPEIEVKIEVDCEAIAGIKHATLTDLHDLEHKVLFFYVYNRFESKIKANVLPLLLTAKATGRYRYIDLLEHFRRIWDTPNKKKAAQDKILNLSQLQNETFAGLLARFERLLHEAEATNWSDDLKIMHLRKALSQHLKRSLDVQLTLPDKYHDFVQACHRLAGRQGNGYQGHQGQGGGAGNAHTQGDPMDLSAISSTKKKLDELCAMDAINSIDTSALWAYEGYGEEHQDDGSDGSDGPDN